DLKLTSKRIIAEMSDLSDVIYAIHAEITVGTNPVDTRLGVLVRGGAPIRR
ncbi:hypothetical protein CCACVL1_29696, partial [Corchorus capsularis]